MIFPVFVLARAPHGNVSSYRAVHAFKVQNKGLSATPMRAVYLVLVAFLTRGFASLWLMCGYGTFIGAASLILAARQSPIGDDFMAIKRCVAI